MPIFSLFHLDSLVNPWHASLLRKFKMTIKRGILFITPNLEWRIQDPMTFWMCPKLSRHQWQNWDPNPSRADTTLDLPKLAAWTGLKGASHLLLFTSPEPFQNVLLSHMVSSGRVRDRAVHTRLPETSMPEGTPSRSKGWLLCLCPYRTWSPHLCFSWKSQHVSSSFPMCSFP